ncbi:hypothetical protein GCM10007874_69520 [Labrys miyagiensis]|uniref:Methyltransferase domain-containing protein n=1 Tax=Labrys miyagiensis TaxID=346912 RepID=A0ABQ6D097_9HYPH|nr:class I SAM-dependent methyltransferase [Labrys miyagiensis]GLS23931.1 hypothetical protein GCM10007874_69520 [Labrys miyagiensis]
MKTLRESFDKSKYMSYKQDSYFPAYDKILRQFVGRPITIVEVGVLYGGSLFMWRDYFGESATIIGVDFNPEAKKWEAEGFKIYIGDQSSEKFWDGLFKEIGSVDILIDDGGHTNRQQIVTLRKAVHHIRDGGLLIVEDTHASYMSEFGNPSRYSFISFAKRIIDHLHGRYGGDLVAAKPPARQIFSVEFFESMTVFTIDRRLTKMSEFVTNGGISSVTEDYRYKNSVLEKLRNRTWKGHRFIRSFYKRLIWLELRRQNFLTKSLFNKIDV